MTAKERHERENEALKAWGKVKQARLGFAKARETIDRLESIARIATRRANAV